MIAQVASGEFLKELEPLGWLHTQSAEFKDCSAIDMTMHARTMTDHKSWLADQAIIGIPTSIVLLCVCLCTNWCRCIFSK